MNARHHLIESLRRLCEKHGGYKAVADRAELDDQSIYQILSGVRLPSGNPKGVGPTMQRKLDLAFPGWSDFTPSATNPRALGEERGRYEAVAAWPFKSVSAADITKLPLPAKQQLERLIAAFIGGPIPTGLDADTWRTVARSLAMAMDQTIGKDVYSAFVLKVEELAHQKEQIGEPQPLGTIAD